MKPQKNKLYYENSIEIEYTLMWNFSRENIPYLNWRARL